MNTLLFILIVLVFAALILTAGSRPVRPDLSRSELKRRAARSGEYDLELERLELLPVIEVAQRLKILLLLLILAFLLIAVTGWLVGILLSFVAIVTYMPLSRAGRLRLLSQLIYLKIEPFILKYSHKFSGFLEFAGGMAPAKPEDGPSFASKEELIEYVENSKAVLSKDERQLIVSALTFPTVMVSDIMTPRSVIDYIKKSEFLGPLVLNELHKLGHSRLPVIDEDINHIVGVLHIRDLLSLDIKRSVTAERAMEKKVYYIKASDTVEKALAAFIKTRHHLFVVINDQRETVGLLTLEDVLEKLLGKKIVDEDDAYVDMKAVAERRSENNNRPTGSVDI